MARTEKSRGSNNSENKEEHELRVKLKPPIVVLIIALVIAASVFAALSLHLISFSHPPPAVHFTVIMDDQGFNNSRTHGGVGPIMNVVFNQTVTIHLENRSPVDTHGFVISHYFAVGVQLRPGQTDDITFRADQAGTFLVYCPVLCSVHTYMIHGQLNVSR